MAPQNVHTLIVNIYEYFTLQSKRELGITIEVKIIELWGRRSQQPGRFFSVLPGGSCSLPQDHSGFLTAPGIWSQPQRGLPPVPASGPQTLQSVRASGLLQNG